MNQVKRKVPQGQGVRACLAPSQRWELQRVHKKAGDLRGTGGLLLLVSRSRQMHKQQTLLSKGTPLSNR